MEGLEVTVINLSDVKKDNFTFRIDSEYFQKIFLNFFKNVKNTIPLSQIVLDGYRVVYENTKILPKSEEKITDPYFLQAIDLSTPFIKKDDLYKVSENDWNTYPKGRIKKGEILIEVKGKIEKVAIVPEDFPEKTLVTGSLFKLTVNQTYSKYTLLSYLISKYGVSFKNRYKTNLLISFISKPDLYRIPVPNFSSILQNKIDNIFESIFSSMDNSKILYQQAESLLLKELGLENFKPTEQAVNIKSLKESFASTGRLDAEYYQPKYEEIIRKIKSCGYKKLTQLVSIRKSIEPGSEAYDTTEGIPFIRVSDYSKMGITDPAVKLNLNYYHSNQEELDKLFPKKDTILFSKDGSIGIAYQVKENLKAITSGAILHLNILDNIEDILPEYLTLVLNSFMVQMQAERDAGGSIINHWRIDQIEDVIIPIIPNLIQQQIAKLIQQSFTLKAQSEHLLEVAKQAVEIAIEQSEEVALAFINGERSDA